MQTPELAKRSTRKIWAVILLVTFALIAFAGAWFVWTISAAKLNWGGASPDRKTLGSLQFIKQRAMDQFCTGIVNTPQAVWLVGRVEKSGLSDLPASGQDNIDLDKVIYGNSGKGRQKDLAGLMYALAPEREYLTFISRLDSNGRFQQVASIGSIACLVASKDGSKVFLLTDTSSPESAVDGGHSAVIAQDVVLRSDDQGKTWLRQKQGFFPEANSIAWDLKLFFHGAQEVWTWAKGDRLYTYREGDPPVALYYSPDLGLNQQRIAIDHSLIPDLSYANSKVPADTRWMEGMGDLGEISVNVVQIDAQHAYAWVFQRFSGASPDSRYIDRYVDVTTRIELHRDGDSWRFVAASRTDGFEIKNIVEMGDGRVLAVVRPAADASYEIAELDKGSLQWNLHGKLPSPFSPLPSYVGIDGLWAGQNALVINVSSEYSVPRWIYPWDEDQAHISTDAVYSSSDGGRSWKHLAIDGYLGVLGILEQPDRVVWAQGSWYDSRDLNIYTYGLN